MPMHDSETSEELHVWLDPGAGGRPPSRGATTCGSPQAFCEHPDPLLKDRGSACGPPGSRTFAVDGADEDNDADAVAAAAEDVAGGTVDGSHTCAPL